MTKQEITEKVEELLEQVANLQSEAFGIAEEIEGTSEKWQDVKDRLIDVDNYIDDAVDQLNKVIADLEEISSWNYETTYREAVKHIGNMILCNSIPEIDEELFEGAVFISTDYEPGEIMQYYLTDCNDSDVEWLCENYDRIIFRYSNRLGLWILLVDHWGTSWDYVEIGTNNEWNARKED